MRRCYPRSHAASCFTVPRVQVMSKTSALCPFSRAHRMYSMPSLEPDPRRIHILGLGNVGLFIAHALAKKPNPPPITLLFHRKSLLEKWEIAGRKISIHHIDGVSTSSGYDIEEIGTNGSKINNLVVATKAMKTLDPMSRISHRLDASSTVLFAQNGMGVISSLKDNLDNFNPNCFSSVITHGLNRKDNEDFRTTVAGLGQISLGQSSELHEGELVDPTSQYLADQIVSSALLNATLVDSAELRKMQLEKLVVNGVLNPITAIFHMRNGMLVKPYSATRKLAVALIREMMPVLQRAMGPENAIEPQHIAFSYWADKVIKVAVTTARNRSSMLQDVLAARQTEIDYINGWIVQEGLKHGLKLRINQLVTEMLKGGIHDSETQASEILALCDLHYKNLDYKMGKQNGRDRWEWAMHVNIALDKSLSESARVQKVSTRIELELREMRMKGLVLNDMVEQGHDGPEAELAENTSDQALPMKMKRTQTMIRLSRS